MALAVAGPLVPIRQISPAECEGLVGWAVRKYWREFQEIFHDGSKEKHGKANWTKGEKTLPKVTVWH